MNIPQLNLVEMTTRPQKFDFREIIYIFNLYQDILKTLHDCYI